MLVIPVFHPKKTSNTRIYPYGTVFYLTITFNQVCRYQLLDQRYPWLLSSLDIKRTKSLKSVDFKIINSITFMSKHLLHTCFVTFLLYSIQCDHHFPPPPNSAKTSRVMHLCFLKVTVPVSVHPQFCLAKNSKFLPKNTEL